MPTAKFSLPQIIRPPASLRRRRLALYSRTAPGRAGESPGAPRGRPLGATTPSLLTDDDAQVLETGQRVLLGVQHLLGRLLHVPVRLLGEHPAAAATAATADSGPLPVRPRRRKVERVGGEATSVSSSFTPQACGPQRSRLRSHPGQGRRLHPPRAAAARHLRFRLQYGGSPLPILHGAGETRQVRRRRPGCLPKPPLAATGRGPGPGAGGGALRGGSTTPLPEAPLRLKLL